MCAVRLYPYMSRRRKNASGRSAAAHSPAWPPGSPGRSARSRGGRRRRRGPREIGEVTARGLPEPEPILLTEPRGVEHPPLRLVGVMNQIPRRAWRGVETVDTQENEVRPAGEDVIDIELLVPRRTRSEPGHVAVRDRRVVQSEHVDGAQLRNVGYRTGGNDGERRIAR